MKWEDIKNLKPSLGYLVMMPDVKQGEGRNGRKRAERAGKPRKKWRYVK